MPRRPLLALVLAVLIGAAPVPAIAAPAVDAVPQAVLHQEEWVQDASGAWVPVQTWTEPAPGTEWTPEETWSDPAAGEAWYDPSTDTWVDPGVADPWAEPAADDGWVQPEFSGFTMPGLTPDNLTESVLRDIDAFWAEEFAARGVTYYAAEIVPVSDTMTTNCGPFGPYDNPAAFCPLEDAIYYSVPLSSDVTAQVGDFAWITVLAHEWGHHVQLLMGIEAAMSMERELQADCFAGAYAQRALLNGFLQEGDVTEAVVMNILGGDPVELSETAQGAHGSSDYRVTAFMQGYFNGADRCFENPSAGL